MITQFRRVVAPLGHRAQSAVWPAVARHYRSDPAHASSFTLKFLGIADASYRPDFYTLANAVDKTLTLPGDIIECGVFRGSTLLGMAHRLALHGILDTKLIGCDSFAGFPSPSSEDALEDGSFHERTRLGVFHETSHEELSSRISALGYGQNISLIKGFFSDTLPQLSNRTFRIVHLDCDLYQSYVTCLEFLYPRLITGGYMVFDEYDFSESVYPGARKAIDEFLADKPEKIRRLSSVPNARPLIVKA